jgi:hypothetical protein
MIRIKPVTTWNERVDNLLKNATINRVLSLTDSTFVIGTLEDGLYAFHLDGSLLWHLNKSNGLYKIQYWDFLAIGKAMYGLL